MVGWYNDVIFLFDKSVHFIVQIVGAKALPILI